MLPDRWGSDADYDAAHGNDWSLDVSRDDWCDEHQQRGTTCGPCHAAGTLTEREMTGDEMVAAVLAAMAKVTARLK